MRRAADLIVGLALSASVASLCGCRTCRAPAPGPSSAPEAACPAQLPAPAALPGERPEHLVAEYWLEGTRDPERILLDPPAIEAHNARVLGLRTGSWPDGRWSPGERQIDREAVDLEVQARLRRLDESLANGRYRGAGGERLSGLREQLRVALGGQRDVDEVRVVWRATPLYCYPTRGGFYESNELEAFDYGQCSQLRYGEPFRVLDQLANGLYYGWSSYATGWASAEALGPPLSPGEASRYVSPERFLVVVDDHVPVWDSPAGGQLLGVAQLGTKLPWRGGEPSSPLVEVLAPAARGLTRGWIRGGEHALSAGYTPFSRAALVRRAFRLLDSPYGWGGSGNKRDCSRLLMDLFGSFGILLPRNSSRQAEAGQHQIDVLKWAERDKVRAIEQAQREGVVLLYFPGHIMLYLGRRGAELYALHLFSGYLVPCRGGGETMYRANRTTVTSLELGRGSSRRSFIERITRLVVFGGAPRAERR